MTGMGEDVRYGLRRLARSPGFTLIAVVTLALGIGANTSIFSLVNAVLLRPPALVAQPERLVSIYTSDFSGPHFGGSSYPDYLDIREATDVFSGVMAHTTRPFSLIRSGESERIYGDMVSANYFELLGLRPERGRFFVAEDDRLGAGAAPAVIGFGLWQRSFGAAPDIVGRTIHVNGQPLAIIGVAPKGFGGMLRSVALDIWVPLSLDERLQDFGLQERGNRGLMLMARLAPGVTLAAAQARLDVVAGRLHAAYPDNWTDVRNQPRVLTLLTERASRVPPQGRGAVLGMVALLMTVVGLVLLIACANIANLLLARATGRQKEIAIRLALGAGRLRLVRQLLTESVALGVLGGLAGVLLALWATDLLMAFKPPIDVPIELDLGLDGRVLAFAAGVSVLTGVIFGLAPALQSTRPDLVPALKADLLTRGRGDRRFGLRNLLVVGQVAGSLVLLIAAGLFLRSLQSAGEVDPGFRVDDVLLLSLDLGSDGYDLPRAQRFYQQLEEKTEALPGVEGATFATMVPLGIGGSRRGMVIEGYQPDQGEDMEFHFNLVGPDYLRTLDIPVVRGRDLRREDREGAPLTVVVNETFARRFWPGREPVGRRISVNGPQGPWTEVVGVARDGKYGSLGEDPGPFAYFPYLQASFARDVTFHVRTASEPKAILPLLRAEVRSLDADLPIGSLTTMREHIGISLLPQRMAASLLSLFGGVALVLAGVGLYGVMAYVVSQRTREIGIRMALGASARHVRGMVVRQGMALAGSGLGVGLVLAFVATRFLGSLLFGIAATDPVTFIGVPAFLAAIAFAASSIPARRATRVDPVVALRFE